MDIIETTDFKKNLNKLPKDMRRLYNVQSARFIQNWKDPRLHVKKVKDLEKAFSFRVTRRYRAFFYFQNPETVIFFTIDHRKEVYRNI